ncbi:MAG TPA: XdhC family protein [Sphingomonas sp.]|nr:XdhC family protein [Sphingomonas sp.]
MLANGATVTVRSDSSGDGDPASAPAATPAEVLRLLGDGMRTGRKGVLATITDLTGAGARGVGAHMAVLDDGESAGSFSSGCIERAIVAEALDVLRDGASRSVRFGQGSPYIDIRLPCGGGMDVLFLADPAPHVIERAFACLDARRPASLHLNPAGRLSVRSEPAATETGWKNGTFAVRHSPTLRLVLVGQGAEMLMALKLARSFGADVELYSPDRQIVAAGLADGAASVRLNSANGPVDLHGDPWTAFLFLFHDHDWEPPLILKALETPAFWVGAMGSRTTHAARCAMLAAHGASEVAIARVGGPVGLIPASRDPATLALSALSEIVGAYRTILP